MTHPAPSDTDSDIPSLTHSKASGTYVLLFVIALILLALLPSQASWVDANRGWYTQPILGPALGLVILTIGAFARIRPTLRRAFSRSQTYKTDYLFDALDGARTALMSSVLFFIYISSSFPPLDSSSRRCCLSAPCCGYRVCSIALGFLQAW